MKKRIISMLLTLAMVGGLAACGGDKPTAQESTPTTVESTASSEAAEPSSEEVAKEPVTITLMPANANLTSGVVGGWLGEYLAEHGIILDVWAYSADKVNAILASGDYPDLMYFDKKVDLNTLAEEGYLLDLNQYLDKLPVLEDSTYKTAINYVQEFITNGTDKLVVLPTGVGESAPKINTGGASLNINWELYEQIGSPEVTCWEDTIDVFKKMQEAWPVSDTGIKTYAMHLYAGADKGYFKGIENVLKLSGYAAGWCMYFQSANTRTGEYEYMLEDDGIYKYALKYINTLYREGLLDPDSITYDRKTVISIVDTEGSTLAGWPNVAAYENKGFMPLYFDDMSIVYDNTNKPYGGNNYLGVSAKCENIDTVLEFLNILYNPDSNLVLKSGPEGELWELDAAGIPVLTEKGYSYFVNGEAVTINGENYTYFNTPTGLNAGNLTSHGRELQANGWTEVMDAKNETEVVKRWKEHYNTTDLKELLGDDLITYSFATSIASFLEAPSEEESLILAAAQDIIIDASWKMVYAETDADFEKIWDDAVKEIEAMGIKELVASRIEAQIKATEIRDSLKK